MGLCLYIRTPLPNAACLLGQMPIAHWQHARGGGWWFGVLGNGETVIERIKRRGERGNKKWERVNAGWKWRYWSSPSLSFLLLALCCISPLSLFLTLSFSLSLSFSFCPLLSHSFSLYFPFTLSLPPLSLSLSLFFVSLWTGMKIKRSEWSRKIEKDIVISLSLFFSR